MCLLWCPAREVLVFLPNGYATDKKRRYPVVYEIHVVLVKAIATQAVYRTPPNWQT